MEPGSHNVLSPPFAASNKFEKRKAGIFDGPQIPELMKDSTFDDALSATELSAWGSLKSVITNCLQNNRYEEYEKEVDETSS